MAVTSASLGAAGVLYAPIGAADLLFTGGHGAGVLLRAGGLHERSTQTTRIDHFHERCSLCPGCTIVACFCLAEPLSCRHSCIAGLDSGRILTQSLVPAFPGGLTRQRAQMGMEVGRVPPWHIAPLQGGRKLDSGSRTEPL